MRSDFVAAHVRFAVPADVGEIVQLLREVFSETYGHVIPDDALNRYVDKAFEARAIAVSSNTFVLAQVDGVLVGVSELATTSPPECVEPRSAIEVARFYIRAEYRGSDVADALLHKCERHARSTGHTAVWLCVWEHNPRAIAFYRRHGFVSVGNVDIVVEGVVFHDVVMVKKVTSNE